MDFKKTDVFISTKRKLNFRAIKSRWGPDGDNVHAREARGTFGKVKLDQVRNKKYLVWKLDITIKEITTLTFSHQRSTLQFVTNLDNNVEYTAVGLGESIWRKHQFNLCFLPLINCECRLQKGNYQVFGIEFSPAYLQKWADAFPLLTDFLQQSHDSDGLKISSTDPTLSPRKLELLHLILNSSATGERLRMYLEPKVLELLHLSLEHISESQHDTAHITLTEHEINQLQAVREVLLQNYIKPPSREELAHMVGSNEFKLKTGFKKLFGSTIHDFVTGLKMEQARKLIIDTDRSIKAISRMVGYDSVQGFNIRFKEWFGTNPMAIRGQRLK